jgi:CRP-like cAMP-binding protein
LTDARLTSALASACSSSWLSAQTPEFRERILRQSKLIKFSKDQRIIRLDERGSDLYFLLEGAVQVLVPRANLEVIPTHVLCPLQWFGEYGALTGCENVAEYRARVPSTALVVTQSRLLGANSDPCFQKAVVELLAGALRDYLELSGGLAGLKGEHRVRSKLHTLSGSARAVMEGRRKVIISQDELAAVSCVSRTVVSKVLAQLETAGIISCGYRCIAIIDRDKLLTE